ncbi:hypothetical protein DY000_02042133 [Brassica cretica]|uniref:Uncharacterized protein n=1 Tax=Brassica cretica TaxID=69181 RepID=A0ABQ7BDL6_BRACR|nr:hypothetical protein DY000_02042133 [Brassica cretica]
MMGTSLDFDVDLEKGIVDCVNVYTQSPEKPLIPKSTDNKPPITGEEPTSPPKLLGRHCTGKANGGFVSVQYAGTPSASEPNGGYTGPGLAQRLPKYVVSNWLRRAELNAIFSKPLRELLSTESEVDDAALISIDSKGIDARVRQGAQEGHGVETLEEAKAALWKVMEKVKLNYLQK